MKIERVVENDSGDFVYSNHQQGENQNLNDNGEVVMELRELKMGDLIP